MWIRIKDPRGKKIYTKDRNQLQILEVFYKFKSNDVTTVNTVVKNRWKSSVSDRTFFTSRIFFYFIFSTLNTVLFYKVPLKPNQKHHLDPIGLLMNRSGSGFLKSWSGSAKSGSIRIRNTENPRAIYSCGTSLTSGCDGHHIVEICADYGQQLQAKVHLALKEPNEKKNTTTINAKVSRY